MKIYWLLVIKGDDDEVVLMVTHTNTQIEQPMCAGVRRRRAEEISKGQDSFLPCAGHTVHGPTGGA
jgi:hypothetical protein